MTDVLPIDLLFLNQPEMIAAYLIPYSGGAVLVESGPGSTLKSLQNGLRRSGYGPGDVTHILLTHIHLDHAGAAGYFASQGAQVCVHPAGAPHLVNPEKLLASARRVYGERMDARWGNFWPVPQASVREVQDGQVLEIGELRVTCLHTPGHADHHVVYEYDGTAFTGDIGGIRLPGPFYVRLPFVPPETDLEKWRDSLERLRRAGFQRLAPTHFGIFDESEFHLQMALRQLDELESWLEGIMAERPTVDVLRQRYDAWMQAREIRLGIPTSLMAAYADNAPADMAANGLFRYWTKVRAAR